MASRPCKNLQVVSAVMQAIDAYARNVWCIHLSQAHAQVAQMLVNAKADDVQLLDVRQHCSFADFMVLATARSHRHVVTAARAIAYQVITKTTYLSTACLDFRLSICLPAQIPF